ncbi:procathepsin L-like [Alosa alosa]|uniref:procathepsin L-like n=1 Tax=Alosa alosa TaxID=278164 RepID=UPI0020152800|nr:procathepsin L-like [Alosa alosa]
MKLLIIAAASLAVVSCASLSLEDLEFQAWKLKFEKSYNSFEEEVQRKLVWLSTRRRVLAHNILADQGIKTYHMGMNQFSDMNNQEYNQAILLSHFNRSNANANAIANAQASAQKLAFAPRQQGSDAELPASVDWRQKGCVNRVKDQHQCGSCWAFGAIAVLESHTCIEHGYLPSLSEQQLLDCSRAYGNHGCHGGRETAAYQYVRDNGGIDTDEAYPYKAKDAICRFKPSGVGALCYGHVELPFGDEEALKETVAFVGPVAVVIDAGQSSFQHYVSGVHYDPHCSKTISNHVVLVVGYGTEDGQDYWLVKNSWGVHWGDQGYIKLSRNQNNQCGVASFGTYPQV